MGQWRGAVERYPCTTVEENLGASIQIWEVKRREARVRWWQHQKDNGKGGRCERMRIYEEAARSRVRMVMTW